MFPSRVDTFRPAAQRMLVGVAVAMGLVLALSTATARIAVTQDAIPPLPGCEDAMSTPAADHGMAHGAMHESTPEGHAMGDTQEMPAFDLAYIDMMIPHHQSIIALANVALPELTDPRLIEMAENIIATQSSEIDTLLEYRQAWYGDAPTVSMEAMMEAMPSMSSMPMDTMRRLMSEESLVTTFCAAENKDLAFIELTIPHHQMAIDTSREAIEQAEHPELVEIAKDVIEAQQAEIDVLLQVKADLTGEATPAS